MEDVGKVLLDEVWSLESSERSWMTDGLLFTATIELARRDSSMRNEAELALTIVNGRGRMNSIELPVTCKPVQLSAILLGFVLSVQEPKRQQPEAPVAIARFRSGNFAFIQQQVHPQWHPNSCGYHALYNIVTHGHKQSEGDLWSYIFRWLRLMERHNERNNMWRKSGLSSVTLDQTQIEFLLEHDPVLRRRKVHAFGSIEDMRDESIETNCSYVIGCVTHWAAIHISEDCNVWFTESFNKPVLQFVAKKTDFSMDDRNYKHYASPRELSKSVMTKYREKFIAKLRKLSHFYKHLPDEMLQSYFENGVAEYWKGKLKNELYWTHRPLELRIELMEREVLAMIGFLTRIQLHLDNSGSTSRATKETPVLALTRSLGVFCTSNKVTSSRLRKTTNYTIDDPSLVGYIRREENWSVDSVEYKSGNNVENRKKPPLPELSGDVFDRQRVIVDFDHGLVRRQVALVLGTGGVGQNTALVLARLGVKEIVLIDYDKVDASNLTRQCLSGLENIDINKVDAARLNLSKCHTLGSTIKTFHGDILSNWGIVVAFAKTCNVMFNCADIGVMFDYCVASLSKELGVPLASGQSFAWKFMSEFYSGQPGENCAFCQESTLSSFGLKNFDHVLRRRMQTKDLVEFMKNDAQFRVSGTFAIALIERATVLADGKSKQSRDSAEWFMAFLQCYHDLSLEALSPGRISSLDNLDFIPRPKYPPTRFYGSWVCPCLSVGNFMVSQWMSYLTSPNTTRNPPTNIVFNLDDGMTSEEQMSYEIGMGLDRSDRSFARATPSDKDCELCLHGRVLDLKTRLIFSGKTVKFRPVKGSVFPVPCAFEQGQVDGLAEAQDGQSVSGSILPVMPCQSPVIYKGGSYSEMRYCPDELSHLPMLKCTEEQAKTEPSSLEGMISGVRSGIVFVKGVAYRLKGCGNNEEGIVLKSGIGDLGESMVRGCMFSNTALQEMIMTDLVQEALSCVGFRCANKSVCFYQYEDLVDATQCYCVVFETIGDRRLGDHLLSGIEKLIPCLYNVNDPKMFEPPRKRFCTERGMDGDTDDMWDTSMVAECGMKVANMSDFNIEETVENLTKIRPDGELLGNFWDQVVEELTSYLEHIKGKSVVMTLAKQIGEEAGTICRTLASNGISWGSYPDSSGCHCNSHANNLVVIVDDDPDVLLAPLDFDMAFTKESFKHEVIENARQKLFPVDWENLIKWEQQMGMRTSLAGSDFTSTGVSNETMKVYQSSESLRFLRCAFRDTIVYAYDRILAEGPGSSRNEEEVALRRAKSCVVKLALMVTYDVVC